jgi:hypothetical protein
VREFSNSRGFTLLDGPRRNQIGTNSDHRGTPKIKFPAVCCVTPPAAINEI